MRCAGPGRLLAIDPDLVGADAVHGDDEADATGLSLLGRVVQALGHWVIPWLPTAHDSVLRNKMGRGYTGAQDGASVPTAPVGSTRVPGGEHQTNPAGYDQGSDKSASSWAPRQPGEWKMAGNFGYVVGR